jgi:RimJ/RimL family protein N-acetyltransferase
MIVFETKKLLVKTIQDEDIIILHEKLFCDHDVMKYAFSQKVFSFKESQEFIEKAFIKDDSKIGLGVIWEKDNDSIIGFAGLVACDYLDVNDYEFGFVLAKESWGKGYASIIGQAQIDLAFNALNVTRILAMVNQDNIPSKKVLEKLKLTYLKDVITEERGAREIYVLERNKRDVLR